MLNQVALIGRTVRQPELKFIPSSGKAVCNFTLAVDKGLSKEQKADFETRGLATADFLRVTVWGKKAEAVANYVGKGKLVGVSGRIETRSYTTQEGEKRSTTEIVAFNVDILEWGNNSNNQNQSNSTDDEDLDDVFEPTDDSEIPF
jgi:single-strand DNA-binding protein